jgi:hypothetical protein
MRDNLDSFSRQQLEFRIQKAMGEQIDDIIDRINTIAEKFSIGNEDKKSPFRSVLSNAVSPSASIASIKLFIQCQIGKSGASPIWSKRIGNELFATALVLQIEQLIEDANTIVKYIRKSIPKNNPLNNYVDNANNQKELTKEIHLKLVQLYLGYLARKHTALVGEGKFK